MRSRWTPWLPIVLAVVVVLGVPAISPSAAAVGASSGNAISVPYLASAPPMSGAPTLPSGPVQVAPAFVPGAGVVEVGPTPPSTVLTVAVGLPSVDPTGLAAYVAATAVAGSTTYRQFLTPAAADARFGAAPAAVSAARTYFAGYGLTTAVNPDGLIVSVT
ncbi:MAG TPA: protease pro-enzyme activation domain-containing protein, partial [Thermoplasmata archaeon]|nr:protease pro-enzyme activation domain-containing protein [Thermoplasmata archaeon]